VAYLARLIIHRYAMLGVLDESGFPLRDMGVLDAAATADKGGTAPPHGRQALPGMRQPDRDPQGRLRLLHRLRLCGAVRGR
jgi:ribonucleoside-diphosphate reductase alpha chain